MITYKANSQLNLPKSLDNTDTILKHKSHKKFTLLLCRFEKSLGCGVHLLINAIKELTMKKSLLAAAALIALVAGSASAEGTLSYNVAATNDYVFRGVSQNSADPALQGGADYANGMFYAGAWASNVSFADYEVDLYAGVKPTLGKFAFDFGAVLYAYNDEDLNITEIKAATTYPVGKGTVGGVVFVNSDSNPDDFIGKLYYEVNYAYPVADKLTFSAAIGEQQYENDEANYTTYNLGLTYALTPSLSLDGRFSDTNADFGKISDGRFAVILKAAF
jgi:uncharacterized protein (TIGR02001 family)